MAEFEFPAYYNFFFTRKKLIIICDLEAKQAVLQVMQETLLGPKVFDVTTL